MCQRQIKSLGVPLPADFEGKYQQMQSDALKHIRKKAVLDCLQEYQMKAEVKFSFKGLLCFRNIKTSFCKGKDKHVSSYFLQY
jgi:hypothetical protein